MAPIIREMEEEIGRTMGDGCEPIDIELPSYVDDLHLNICVRNRHMGEASRTLGMALNMERLLERADEIMNRVAEEKDLPLEDSKHKRLVLRNKRRRAKKDVKWVKWNGIIMDKSRSFKMHWKSRIEKARKILAQLSGLGNSNWAMGANSWRAAYTGI